MPQAIILAGGFSKRTGINKLSLLFKGIPLIHHVIDVFLPYTDKIIVVSGHYHEELVSLLRKYDRVEIVRNLDYPKGMFSSVLKGVAQTDDDFFITPGDYPLISSKTIEQLLSSNALIAVPVFNGRRGHPILIRKQLKEELLKEPIESNLKVFRDRHHPVSIEVEDEGILIDVDTLSDYNDLTERKE